ncbi:hypothetical protein PS663_05778 [Pseudomonas fluorescens]|nr:hypothetical protein PS663_05778 [Pseudomonas fluorescens]
MFSICMNPTAPVDCSESTMRIRTTASARRIITPLPSQRVINSGLARLCSMARPAMISTREHAEATPIHGASSHQSMRPKDSTAQSRATPVARMAKVRKSSFSKVLKRSPGGSLSRNTQPRQISAMPNSNRYRPRHSAICSRSSENRRARGKASCAVPSPSTSAFRRHLAGNAWIM